MNPASYAIIAVIIASTVYSLARKTPVSLVYGVAFILIFAFEVLSEFSIEYSRPVMKDLAFQGSITPVYIWPLTLLTSMFLHANLMHLLFNMLALILIGAIFEEKIGTLRFIIIYLVSGIAGTLFFALLHWGETYYLIGASGAIMGILGGFARLYPRQKLSMFYFFIPIPPLPVPVIVAIVLLIETFFALTSPGYVAHEAHIGGIVAGILLAPLVMRVGSSRSVAIARKIDLSRLQPLATSKSLAVMLQRVEKESVEDVKLAWLDYFFEQARCPKCGGRLKRKGRTAFSECGWKIRF